jgi:hypothetical protein
MSAVSESSPSDGAQTLRALYDTSLGPYLAAQDAQVRANRRNRWLVLIIGLALAAGFMALALRPSSNNEFLPTAAFVLAVGAIGLFIVMKGALADTVRDHLMAQIAPTLGLRFDVSPNDVAPERFEILGLAGCEIVKYHDRLSGQIGGLAADMMTARLVDVTTTGVGNDKTTTRTERFSGVLMRVDDPAPSSARFRLVPPAALSPKGVLRSTSVTIRSPAGQPQRSTDELLAMVAATPQRAPATPTGDPAFDARFELHSAAPDVAVALARLDAGTRAALLDISARFGGGPVSIGFDAGGILLAFETKQRFEIGELRPPMAQFERVQHLADQMSILATIADRIRTARSIGSPTQTFTAEPLAENKQRVT